jgi:hypothetical protein
MMLKTGWKISRMAFPPHATWFLWGQGFSPAAELPLGVCMGTTVP